MSIVENPVVVVTTDPLAVLATEINTTHDAACRAAASALEHARDCGNLLIQAKADVGHGGWLLWLKSHCRVKERQARNYMLLARNWETISKSAPGAEMTVKGALQLIGDDGDEDTLTADEQAKLANCEAIIRENINKAKIPENSEFGLPAILPTDSYLYGICGDDAAEVTPSLDNPGYFWVAVYRDISTLSADVVFARRPILADFVCVALQHSGFGTDVVWGNVEWDRRRPWWTLDIERCAPARRATA
ncbi:MAG: DUF3102 domain-containing protein [Pirellulaceae bacterium]|nr:DUF3102 domain-containing protein [Pirellulaceae bacterium]